IRKIRSLPKSATVLRSKRQAMKETEYPGKRWHQGVNYFFDTPEIKSVFKKATELWMNNMCIDTREEKYVRDTVRVYKGEVLRRSMPNGAIRSLPLGPGCESLRPYAGLVGINGSDPKKWDPRRGPERLKRDTQLAAQSSNKHCSVIMAASNFVT
ncbi:hypothetical protein OSTOST_22144, partial [Ostertagia ostertagi]